MSYPDINFTIMKYNLIRQTCQNENFYDIFIHITMRSDFVNIVWPNKKTYNNVCSDGFIHIPESRSKKTMGWFSNVTLNSCDLKKLLHKVDIYP